jgi:hypothetical protein
MYSYNLLNTAHQHKKGQAAHGVSVREGGQQRPARREPLCVRTPAVASAQHHRGREARRAERGLVGGREARHRGRGGGEQAGLDLRAADAVVQVVAARLHQATSHVMFITLCFLWPGMNNSATPRAQQQHRKSASMHSSSIASPQACTAVEARLQHAEQREAALRDRRAAGRRAQQREHLRQRGRGRVRLHHRVVLAQRDEALQRRVVQLGRGGPPLRRLREHLRAQGLRLVAAPGG